MPQITALLKKTGDWIVPISAVAMVFIMLVPLPSFVLDLLLTVSITASILVLLTAIQVLRPVQFSVFPSLLLLLTLLRLSLDLAGTRRILLHGNEGTSAAGKVIEAFGQFVVGGNYIVGFVLFIALIAIQFLVISHGAVRTAEVTARFTLDAMPGKQMAIDADLNAGVINEAQAKLRRERVAQEAEFCGAMDGAARFSQRDSLATILILAINIIAGFLIGVFQQGVPFAEALKTYTILTVGDGLVSILPSLLVSVAGGIVITRSASKETLGVNVGKQLFASPRILWIAGGALAALGLIPGLPKFAFFSFAAALMVAAYKMKPQEVADEDKELAMASGPQVAADGQVSDSIEAVLAVDPLTLEVGLGLVSLVDVQQGGQLLSRLKSMRKKLAMQLGFLVPSIHITDNLALRELEYVIQIKGVEIARWELRRDCLLAISSDPKAPDIPGQDTREPAFDANAKWINPQAQGQAIAAGYAVVDPTSVLAAHIAEVIKEHAHELLSRHETKRLIDRLADSHPKLTEDLIPKLMSLGEVQKVLQQLLREQVSIRDLGSILETLMDAAGFNKNTVHLVEAARHTLARGLIRPLLTSASELKVVTLDQSLEEECLRGANLPQTSLMSMPQQVALARRVLDGLRNAFGDEVGRTPPVLLCSSPGRYYLRQLLEPFIPRIVVISPNEIPPKTLVQSVGILR
jgi:flagellar biosynthesis protein FlhA